MLSEFGDQLIIVENHSHDIFEIPWCEDRIDLYSSALMPNVRIDGKYFYRGADSAADAANHYRPLINQRLAETNSEAQINVTGSCWFDGNTVYAGVTYTLLGSEAPINPRAFVLMVVDGLVWHDVTYHDVTQGAFETDLDLTQTGDAASLITDFTMDPEWTSDMISCIAFVQDMDDSLQIRQTIRLPVDEPFNEIDDSVILAVDEVLQAWPNPYFPAAGSSGIRFSLCRQVGLSLNHSAASEAGTPINAIRLFDSSGRVIRQLSQAGGDQGAPAFVWDGRDQNDLPVPAGAYWARPARGPADRAIRIVLIR